MSLTELVGAARGGATAGRVIGAPPKKPASKGLETGRVGSGVYSYAGTADTVGVDAALF